MNSCAASCCTCFRKVLCASGTSASSPTAGAPRSYHCVHLLGSAPQTEQDLAGCKDSSDFWLCPKYGGPMWSSKDSLLPRPTSLSSGPGHCCRMKRLTTARILSAYKFAQSLCALPFHKPRLSTFSSYFFTRILHLPHPFPPALPAALLPPNLPTIEFA
jgi:hypothetical protein